MKKTFIKIKSLLSGLILTLSTSFAAIILFSSTTHAAGVFTFTGAACSTNCNWSTAGNWSGNAAPSGSDSGDIIVISNTTNTSPIDDISGLSISGLYLASTSGGSNDLVLNVPITVSGTISNVYNGNVGAIPTIEGASPGQTITLGADTAVNYSGSSGSLDLGSIDKTDTIALAGHTLTYSDIGTAPGIIASYVTITGNGTVNYNTNGSEMQLYGNSSYTGTTNVNTSGSTLPVNDLSGGNAFGSSTINVSSVSGIAFSPPTPANLSITNQINIAGSANGANVTSLEFSNSGYTINFPHITLNGNTRFGNSGGTANLAGITTNGFCIEYLSGASSNPDGPSNGIAAGTLDGPSNGFLNGPTGCIVNTSVGGSVATTSAKAPNTGSGLVSSPFLLGPIGLTAIGAGAFLIKRRFTSSNAKRSR